jgi:hypothetical protein
MRLASVFVDVFVEPQVIIYAWFLTYHGKLLSRHLKSGQ